MKNLALFILLLFMSPKALEDHIQTEPTVFKLYPQQSSKEYFFDLANIGYKIGRHSFMMRYQDNLYFFDERVSTGSYNPFSSNNNLQVHSHYFEKTVTGFQGTYCYEFIHVLDWMSFNLGFSAGKLHVRYQESAYDQTNNGPAVFSIQAEETFSSNFSVTSSIEIGKQFWKNFGLFYIVRGDYYLNKDNLFILRSGLKISI